MGNPSHTYQFLHWYSHQHIGTKYSVINTLDHRDKTVSFTPELLKPEKRILKGNPYQMQVSPMGRKGVQEFQTKQHQQDKQSQ